VVGAPPAGACRAVLFASLVDDPFAHPDRFPTEEAPQEERERLFRIIEDCRGSRRGARAADAGVRIVAMTRVRWQVLDGKIRYSGRTLAEWVPQVVADLVAVGDPLRVLLFGSVARGDDGPDSDIDLLVVLPTVDRRRRHEVTVDLAHAITAPVPVDLLVTDQAEIAERDDLPGILRVALREGRVVHERPG